MKKFLAILLSVMLVMTFGVVAFATGSITISNNHGNDPEAPLTPTIKSLMRQSPISPPLIPAPALTLVTEKSPTPSPETLLLLQLQLQRFPLTTAPRLSSRSTFPTAPTM